MNHVNIKFVVEQHASSENTNKFRYYFLRKFTAHLSQQTVKQIEVIQVVASPEVSKANHSVMNKNIFTGRHSISHKLMDRVIK